jgi:predicted protein tyrosine phosphatase
MQTTDAGLELGRVLFVSQQRAEAMKPPKSCALISITDTDKAPAKLLEGWAAVLRVSFDDVDPVSFPDHWDSEGLLPCSALQAVEIADFCRFNALRCRRLVVHCRYGVSRSAAVAKALCEVAGLWFPADYEDHNDFVYQESLSAMRRAFHRSASPIANRPTAQ